MGNMKALIEKKEQELEQMKQEVMNLQDEVKQLAHEIQLATEEGEFDTVTRKANELTNLSLTLQSKDDMVLNLMRQLDSVK